MDHEALPIHGPEEMPSTVDIWEDAWNDALERVSEVADEDEMSAVMDISLTDADAIAAWRDERVLTLTPQSIFFLTISEAAKRRA